MPERFDVLIIGAGPAGMSAALASKQERFIQSLLLPFLASNHYFKCVSNKRFLLA